jgi:hypothetical protein
MHVPAASPFETGSRTSLDAGPKVTLRRAQTVSPDSFNAVSMIAAAMLLG